MFADFGFTNIYNLHKGVYIILIHRLQQVTKGLRIDL